MNTIVLNILSKNNLLVEREQFQLEFIEFKTKIKIEIGGDNNENI